MPDMSLSRAFTTRKAKMGNEVAEANKRPLRSSTTKYQPGGVRNKISGPVHLVHTTKMLSYNAPDLPRAHRSNSTTNSHKSDEESELNTPAESTPPTSPDASPLDTFSPPEPNHLSSYFMAPPKPPTRASPEPPVIPRRSPSHTKKHSIDNVARQRSVSQMSKDSERTLSTKASFTFSRSSSTSTRASSVSQVSAPYMKEAPPPVPAVTPALMSSPSPVIPEESHPFGKELAQVTELAEEYGMQGGLHIIDEEQQYLDSRGLVRFGANDYLNDVQELFATFIQEVKVPIRPLRPNNPLWI